MVGEKLTVEPVNFQLDHGSDVNEPQLLIYLDGRIKQPQALSMLKAVIARIQAGGLPQMKVDLPKEIIGTLHDVFERLSALPDRVRDCVVAYIDERLSTTSSREVDDE
jgi:hypothetical protein